MKKILKIASAIIALGALGFAGLILWNWGRLRIFTKGGEIQGAVGQVPVAVHGVTVPPLTQGDQDWICWRGPAGDGRSPLTGIPTDGSKGLKKAWEVDFLCRGEAAATWSAPVIRGNRVIVTGRDETNDLVFCLNSEDGALIWKGAYPIKARGSYGAGARATPWIDADRVYTFGRRGDLICWSLLDGAKLWHRKMDEEGGTPPQWGHSSSPWVTENQVIVSGGGQARTIAFDKMSGETQWKVGGGKAGFAAITSVPIDETPALLTFHATGLAAIRYDGTPLWDFPWVTKFNVNATTPVAVGDRIFITSDYKRGGALLKVTSEGAEVVWTNTAIASHHSDPHIINGYIYGYSGNSTQNRGKFKCLDLETGAEKWSTNRLGWGTCLYVDGYLLCSDIKRNLYWVKPSPDQLILAAKMPTVMGKIRTAAWTVPVIANGRLYLRHTQRLACYDLKGRQEEGKSGR